MPVVAAGHCRKLSVTVAEAEPVLTIRHLMLFWTDLDWQHEGGPGPACHYHDCKGAPGP